MAAILEFRHMSRQSVFLSLGFRPFFLGAAAHAALLLPLWLALYALGVHLPLRFEPLVWHAHEMVFGYTGAVIAGFLLTAIPNWTGRAPLTGVPLGLLFASWLAGRLALALGSTFGPLASLVDIAFPVLLAIWVWREILSSSYRNGTLVGAMVTFFALANAGFHVQYAIGGGYVTGYRAGLLAIAVLISIIGGRIVPAFTRNWLVAHGAKEQPRVSPRLDHLVIATTVLALAVWLAQPYGIAAAVLLAAAAAVQSWRLAGWRGFATREEPLLFVLHAGYAWIPLALTLLALAAVFPAVPATTALHALTAGAIGTMTIAVMSRASLGHTGHPLTADRRLTACYVLVGAGALLRVAAPWLPVGYVTAVSVSGLVWAAGFLGFLVRFAPSWLSPRA
ncbi:MAG: NnrS family protein [Gammaproteobacteria bacterium]|nr:NnrS family protein [Gammaproteobacteria bacterium]MBI5615914.1 NnrS family protein [Gammaproteobacteria bacterium]